jgi:hypothetical protein
MKYSSTCWEDNSSQILFSDSTAYVSLTLSL